MEKELEINSPSDMAAFFHSRVIRKYPWFSKKHSAVPSKGDVTIAKNYLKDRTEAGLTEQQAYKEFKTVIEYLFEYGEDFLDDPIVSFGIFGRETSGWIVDKVLNIIYSDLIDYQEIKLFEEVSAKKTEELVEDHKSTIERLTHMERIINDKKGIRKERK